MGFFNNITGELHRIKVKLYPNYLPQSEGAYIARTNNESCLSIEKICAAMKSRGGYKGDYQELVDSVKRFFDEAAYQLCDGFSVNTGYFSIHPNVGGTFNSAYEKHDNTTNPVNFHFRSRAMLNELAKHISVEIEGIADANSFIDEYYDCGKKTFNSTYAPDHQFSISGHKIKIAGDDPGNGVYFVPSEDPSKAVKVTSIAENTSSKIIGIASRTGFVHNRIQIRTQFTGSSNTFLKSPRSITSNFILEAS